MWVGTHINHCAPSRFSLLSQQVMGPDDKLVTVNTLKLFWCRSGLLCQADSFPSLLARSFMCSRRLNWQEAKTTCQVPMCFYGLRVSLFILLFNPCNVWKIKLPYLQTSTSFLGLVLPLHWLYFPIEVTNCWAYFLNWNMALVHQALVDSIEFHRTWGWHYAHNCVTSCRITHKVYPSQRHHAIGLLY